MTTQCHTAAWVLLIRCTKWRVTSATPHLMPQLYHCTANNMVPFNQTLVPPTIKSYECCIACVHSHDTYLPVVQACLVLATIVSWTPSPMHQPLCKADHYAMCEQVCGSLLTTFITADYMHSNVTAMVVHSWHIMTEIQVNETCAHTDLIAVLSTARWACISGASFVAERLACCNILTISIKADS